MTLSRRAHLFPATPAIHWCSARTGCGSLTVRGRPPRARACLSHPGRTRTCLGARAPLSHGTDSMPSAASPQQKPSEMIPLPPSHGIGPHTARTRRSALRLADCGLCPSSRAWPPNKKTSTHMLARSVQTETLAWCLIASYNNCLPEGLSKSPTIQKVTGLIKESSVEKQNTLSRRGGSRFYVSIL